MTEQESKEIQRLLRQKFPPMDPELRRDLWPAMLRRVDTSGSTLPWYDWALIGVSAGALTFFPQLILVFVYHL